MKKRLTKSARILIFLGLGWVISCGMLSVVLNSSIAQQGLLNYVQTSTGIRIEIAGAIRFAVFPYLRVTLEQVKVYLSEEQNASEFIRLGKAELELKFWPVLRNQWVLRRVLLEDWAVNWVGVAQGAQAETTLMASQTAGQASWVSKHLSIEQLMIRQGRFHVLPYPQQPFDVRFEDINFQLDGLRSGQLAELQVNSNIHFAEQSWTITGQAQVFFDSLIFKVAGLNVQLATSNGLAQANFSMPALIYERTPQILQATEMQLQSAPLLLKLSLAGTGTVDAADIQGRVVLDKFNLRSWLARWGIPAVEPENLTTLQQLALELNWHLTPATFEVHDLNLLIDQSRLHANIGFKRDTPVELTFTVQLDQLDVTRYFYPNSDGAPLVSSADFLQGSAPATSLFSDLQTLPIHGKLNIDILKWGEVAMQDVALDLTSRSGQFAVHPSMSGASQP